MAVESGHRTCHERVDYQSLRNGEKHAISQRLGTRHQFYDSLRLITLNLLTGTALLLAQDPQNWRMAPLGTTRRLAPAPQAQASQTQQDGPSYWTRIQLNRWRETMTPGYPEQAQQSLQGLQQRPPAAVPHYGLPTAVAIKPGTFITIRMEQGLSSDHNQRATSSAPPWRSPSWWMAWWWRSADST